MAYRFIVAKVQSTFEIPNADRVHGIVVLNEILVAKKEIKEGFVGIFAETDIQLSEEFCHHNNLFRNKEMNKDKEIGGFFENSRRVRTQPFLGVKSSGFFFEKEMLGFTGANLDELVLGQEFDVLNGHQLCNKYISEKQKQAMANVAKAENKAKTKSIKGFEQHTQTAQFKHAICSIPKGALLGFHAKVHGCFPSNQKIQMWDGTKKNFSAVRVGDYVAGYRDGEIVKSKVLRVFDNGRTDEWLKIKYSRNNSYGNKTGKITCTKNHEIRLWNDSYVHAGDLKVGDSVVFGFEDIKPNSSIMSAIAGMYLGDGSLNNNNTIELSHKEEHLEYFNWKKQILGVLGETATNTRVSGYGSNIVYGAIRTNKFVQSLFFNADINKTDKRLFNEIVDIIDPLGLAIWYMDDGSLLHHKSQNDRCLFATCSYTSENDISIISKIFEKFDIIPIHYVDSEGYNRIRLNTSEAYKLFELIKDYVPNCMKYKLPEEFRDIELKKTDVSFDRGFAKFKQNIIEITLELKSNRKKYDMETETVNYMAGEIIVHNSSFRVGKHLVKQELSVLKGVLNHVLGREIFPKYEYEYVLGTRRTVLKNEEVQGFHGSEQFRYEVLEKLKPFLEDGMTIYGEIAGYVNNKPVMGTHETKTIRNKEFERKYGKQMVYSYGCEPGQYRFHIYRITHQINGREYDLSAKQIETFCESKGLLPHLNVHEPMVYNGNQQELLELVERLTERPECLTEDYIDPRHVSEGIIVRVDYGTDIPKFFKSKSFAFKIMEGIYKENNVDVEDAN